MLDISSERKRCREGIDDVGGGGGCRLQFGSGGDHVSGGGGDNRRGVCRSMEQ